MEPLARFINEAFAAITIGSLIALVLIFNFMN